MAYYRPPGPPPDPALVRSLTQQQQEMRLRVRHEPLAQEPRLIAGCDSSFPTPNTILSVFVVLEFPSLQLIEKVYNYGPSTCLMYRGSYPSARPPTSSTPLPSSSTSPMSLW